MLRLKFILDTKVSVSTLGIYFLFSGFFALVPCISWVTLRSQVQKTCTFFEYCEHLVLRAGRLSGESISYYCEMAIYFNVFPGQGQGQLFFKKLFTEFEILYAKRKTDQGHNISSISYFQLAWSQALYLRKG